MLIVKSGINKLRSVSMRQAHASYVASHLVAEGASFYCEPQPAGVVKFQVDEEHLPALVRLHNAARDTASPFLTL